MGARGFSLVELLIIIALMGILMAIATLSWQEMRTKSYTESQIRTMHADLMSVRLQALYGKRARSVVIADQLFKVYSTADTSVSPIETKKLTYPTVSNVSGALVFDAQGLLNGNQRSICILPTNDTSVVNAAAVDSLVISQTRINLGKRTEGDCKSDNIEQK